MTLHIDSLEAEVDIAPAESSGSGGAQAPPCNPDEVERLRPIVLRILEEELDRIRRR